MLWRKLVEERSLLRAALRGVVADGNNFAALMQLRQCWMLLEHKAREFDEALASHYCRPGEPEVNIERLARHFKALIATAFTAATAKQMAAAPDESHQTLITLWAQRSAMLLPNEAESESVWLASHTSFAPGDPAQCIEQAYREMHGRKVQSAAARYWSLYWLNDHRRLTKESLEVPVAAADHSGRGGILANLKIYQLEPLDSAATLFEHPETALLPFGDLLLDGIKRAWRSAPEQTVCWKLGAPPIPQNGDSLSGAAAVGFNLLLKDENYKSTCIVIASVGEDGRSLRAVRYEREKLLKAHRDSAGKIRYAVLGPVNQSEHNPTYLSDEEISSLALNEKVRVYRVPTLDEAIVRASFESEEALFRTSDRKILGRYSRQEKLPQEEDQHAISESWIGADDENREFLIRLRSFGNTPQIEGVERALWDKELRILYRLCSSPSAEESILKLHDAGVDHHNQKFVIVLQGYGYQTLDVALAKRNDYSWLMDGNLREKDWRRNLWRGLLRIARGIHLLHEQQVIHGDIRAENIFINSTGGTNLWRLGGFEWSMLLGRAHGGESEVSWSIPPECVGEEGEGYSFDTDWYSFGLLAARCFYRLETLKHYSPEEINRYIVEAIDRSPDPLIPVESEFILRLIARQQRDRLRDSTRIINSLEEIISSLNFLPRQEDRSRGLVVVFNHHNTMFSRLLAERTGFLPNPENSVEEYTGWKTGHVQRLKAAFREEFKDAQLYPDRFSNDYLLVGKHINLLIGPYSRTERSVPTWDAAKALKVLTSFRSDYRPTDLKDITIRFATIEEYPQDQYHQISRRRPQSWERYLPGKEQKDLRENLERFREFLRCTNQLELLMRYAEIFPYQIVERDNRRPNQIVIQEEPMARNVPEFCRTKNMLEFLQREQEDKGKGQLSVILTATDQIRIPRSGAADEWMVEPIQRSGADGAEAAILRLSRPSGVSSTMPPPETGFLRVSDFNGQITLIERRKNAIDRLREHSYLLSSLVQPGEVFMDTGQGIVPKFPPGVLDEHKERVIKNILRVRPLFALQGPPGTGKTTLVTYLLREILREDKVAQILVTAQAHGAVDVLREKVDATFEQEEKPLSVRLGINRHNGEPNRAQLKPLNGTVEEVAAGLLDDVHRALYEKRDSLSPIQKRWFELVNKMRSSAVDSAQGALQDFHQLVRRGANIVYCTSSARDLEELIEGSQEVDLRGGQSYDWTIVEEAGKMHGFDLALPLQAGHRWMLLGDQEQLFPYRYHDFAQGIEHLEDAVKVLKQLRRERGLIDDQWIMAWEERNQSEQDENGKESKEQAEFKRYCLDWLRTFDRIYEKLRTEMHDIPSYVTDFNYEGSAAGKLLVQYRMHPTIGKLIAETFYSDDGLEHATEQNGQPTPEVCHPFYLPANIKNKALVWIDIPWCRNSSTYAEQGWRDNKPGYTSPHEVEAVRQFLSQLRFEEPPKKKLKLVVLSPYNRQVSELESALRGFQLPEGLEFRQALHARAPGRGEKRAHTVDSFQGNQADVVIISMVRNNRIDAPKGLGFLIHPERLNVLMSRAERLLVIVGSWDFFKDQLKDFEGVDKDEPLWYWQTMLRQIEKAIEEKRGVKLSYPLR